MTLAGAPARQHASSAALAHMDCCEDTGADELTLGSSLGSGFFGGAGGAGWDAGPGRKPCWFGGVPAPKACHWEGSGAA